MELRVELAAASRPSRGESEARALCLGWRDLATFHLYTFLRRQAYQSSASVSDKSILQCWSSFCFFKHCKNQPVFDHNSSYLNQEVDL